MVKLLLERGANPNTGGVIWKVAEEGRIGVVKLLLDTGADMTMVDVSGRTVLQAAVEKGQEDVVKLLLDRGANPNLKGSEFPLIVACGNEKIFKLLLAAGANPNTPNLIQKAASDG